MAAAIHQARRKAGNKPFPDREQRREQRARVPTRRRTHAAWHEFLLLFKEWIGWLVLLPWSVLCLMTFCELMMHAAKDSTTWRSPVFGWFLIGSICWLALFAAARRTLMILYVFGHELSHVIAAKLSGAVVYDWHVGRDGGWVDTNKSNTFISLAPYLLPLYTMAVILVYGIAGLFVNLETVHHVDIGGWSMPFNAMKMLCLLIGFTWTFHFTYTLHTLRVEQSDVLRNGGFFSGWLIVLCNLHVIMALLITASPALHWSDAWGSMHASAGASARFVWDAISLVGNKAWAVLGQMFRDVHGWKLS